MIEQTVGILGGGQLGLMFAQAASRYGVAVRALCPEVSPIIARAALHIHGEYCDTDCLDQLIVGLNSVTLEFENIPVSSLEYLAERVNIRPGSKALEIAQDRRLEKKFFQNEANIPTTRFAIIETEQDLEKLSKFPFPAVLKTALDGYDGKGQIKVERAQDLTQAWSVLKQVPCVLEAFVDFQEELSVIIARGVAGDVAIYGPFLNEHRDHILATSWSGHKWSESILKQAHEIALTTAEHLEYVGVLCVELFLVGETLLVNEMAPRPHNSGHLTIEGFNSCQFDQQVRATLGLSIAQAELRRPAAMINLVGRSLTECQQRWLLSQNGVHLHWYGKNEVQPGRKLGHITLEANHMSDLQAMVSAVRSCLSVK